MTVNLSIPLNREFCKERPTALDEGEGVARLRAATARLGVGDQRLLPRVRECWEYCCWTRN